MKANNKYKIRDKKNGRYVGSFFPARATIVDGKAMKHKTQTLLLVVLNVCYARRVLIGFNCMYNPLEYSDVTPSIKKMLKY